MKKLLVSLALSICLLDLVSRAEAITEMTPPYTLPHSAYGNTYDRYFTYYDAAGSIQYVYVKQGYNYHDFDVYYYWAGQTIVARNVGGATFSYNTLIVQCTNQNTDCFEWSTYGSVMSIPSSCATPPILSTFDLHWGDAAMSQYADPLYCGIGVLSANQQFVAANIVAVPPETPLEFPLFQSTGTTPWTAPISSVMDHSGTTPYSDSDHLVVSFEGEASEVQMPHPNSTCYAKNDSSSFGVSINYVGTSASGGSYYLCYNGHPGYDYPQPQGTDISAPADGTLCVATSATQPQGSGIPWRDTTKCPLATAGLTSWSGYHTFYIVHQGLRINGSVDNYLTVFLHNDSLDASVESEVEANGYADVSRLQRVAYVGHQSPDPVGNHMHFEVYKWNTITSAWDRVDPYGDGVNNILWQH